MTRSRACAADQESSMFDTIIRGGTVVDGSGDKARTADVGIKDGRIAAIGTLTEPAHET
jgi:N-acyl-D-aspartate/D-glutamate deacylase